MRALTPPFETAAIILPESEDEHRRTVDVILTEPFRPFSLVLWGVTPGTLVHQLSVGHTGLLAGSVPAVMFEGERAWSWFRSLLEPSKNGYPRIADSHDLGKFFRFDLPASAIGEQLRLDIDGGYAHGAVLGRVIEQSALLEQSA